MKLFMVGFAILLTPGSASTPLNNFFEKTVNDDPMGVSHSFNPVINIKQTPNKPSKKDVYHQLMVQQSKLNKPACARRLELSYGKSLNADIALNSDPIKKPLD
jgi:hypothetical protein